MCGIVGLVHSRATASWDPERAIRSMTHSLVHRGPDDAGIELDREAGVYLGFRRLAILDLSPAGHQPMESASKRYVITFNGEIYNFQCLRRELEQAGWSFKSGSDTEVMLAAFERWGCREAVPRFRGMFAFALWDRRDRTLWLVRDRVGIKPLYYLQSGTSVAWASEARAIRHCPLYGGEGDPDVAGRFLRQLYVPGSASILKGVEKIAPGEMLELEIGSRGVERCERTRYWNLPDIARRCVGTPQHDDEAEALDGLHELLRESVRLRLIADVPVGALLSGGIDSSVVVGIIQSLSSRPVKTFTISFDEPSFDEGPAAADIARHLGTDHTSVSFRANDVMALVPTLPELSDEPMANPSLLPTLLVSRIARREVVVALSGDGGDELFGGYQRYVHGSTLIRTARRVPAALRALAGRGVESFGGSAFAAAAFDRLKPGSMGGQQSPAERLLKAAAVMRSRGESEAYDSLFHVGMVHPPLITGRAPQWGAPPRLDPLLPTLEQRMMLADQVGYLHEDLLTKVDRASMWESLEARVPILDHHVVEYSWRLPLRMKIRNGMTKWALRQIASSYVPAALLDRPKMGFTAPIARWLRGGLRSWAQDSLSRDAVCRVGLLDPRGVDDLWKRFDAGAGHLALALWSAAVLHAWADCHRVTF
ncbi:MAG: asparagine synthase (glutamine-hydrolyzing) [Gemmatimonadota bacterium]